MSAALPTPLFVALAALGLAAVLWWGLRHPMFSIVAIQVQGDLTHNNAVTLRANVAHRLSGNLFTLDLAAARTAFEGVPWVRKALVRREFPNRLNVQLQEHLPVAYWGDEGESLLLNTFGEVFEANLGDVEADKLPRLSGPQGQSAQLLAMYRFRATGCGHRAAGADRPRQLACSAGQRHGDGAGAWHGTGSPGTDPALREHGLAGHGALPPKAGQRRIGGPAPRQWICVAPSRRDDRQRGGGQGNGQAAADQTHALNELDKEQVDTWQKNTKT